ncbi:MAG: alpha/beta hydrolase [Clostridiales Family XIII bacterium]|jgi:pimeloyl-ACP methyl ester carboxylesterase|nr:alpha/beta hydrolase [Clostridiales Family XIII bacterium]
MAGDVVLEKRRPLWLRALRGAGVAALVLAIVCGALFFWARAYNTAQVRIGTSNGIDTQEYIEIGGIKQYIQIRGQDRSNPVVLLLHGGPGQPEALQYYLWQKPLQADFTFVDWDQRGAGNTYYENDGDCGVVDQARLVQDIDEIVDYLREEFGQEKIIIVGHSFGSTIGVRYVQAHPEKVRHYFGVGQMAGSLSEMTAEQVREAAEIARAGGDEEAAADMELHLQSYLENLEALRGEPAGEGSETIFKHPAYADWGDLRRQTYKYLPDAGRSDLYIGFAGAVSPRATMNDLKWWLGGMSSEGALRALDPLERELFVEDVSLLDGPMEFKVPVTFIMGAEDWVTPGTLAEAYLERIDAPAKQIRYVEDAGHTPMWDNPEQFAYHFKKALKGA